MSRGRGESSGVFFQHSGGSCVEVVPMREVYCAVALWVWCVVVGCKGLYDGCLTKPLAFYMRGTVVVWLYCRRPKKDLFRTPSRRLDMYYSQHTVTI